MSGFVYIWRDCKHNRYYIGSHWGKPDDGYVCSSSWMKSSYKKRSYDFKRRVLKVVSSRVDLLAEEQRWLNMIKPEESKTRYYNLNLRVGHWHGNRYKPVCEKIRIVLGTNEYRKGAGERSHQRWSDPEYYKRVRDKIDTTTQSPEHRKQKSDVMNRPDIRKKTSKSWFSKDAWKDPVFVEKMKKRKKLIGTKFYNNGIIQKMFIPGQEPKEWVSGRLNVAWNKR